MSTKIAGITGIVLVAAIGIGVAAKRYMYCSGSTAACEAPDDVVAIGGAPTGDYDNLQSIGCQMSCAKKDVPEGTVIAAQPEVEVGQTTRCPVSGVIFVATTETAKMTIGTHTYYACCAGCIEKLESEPSRFVRL